MNSFALFGVCFEGCYKLTSCWRNDMYIRYRAAPKGSESGIVNTMARLDSVLLVFLLSSVMWDLRRQLTQIVVGGKRLRSGTAAGVGP